MERKGPARRRGGEWAAGRSFDSCMRPIGNSEYIFHADLLKEAEMTVRRREEPRILRNNVNRKSVKGSKR